MPQVPYFRIAVVKATGMETVTVDMPSWNPVTGDVACTTGYNERGLVDRVPVSMDDMKDSINKALDVLDERASQAQLRMLSAYDLIKYFPNSVQSMIIQLIDVMNGQADPKLVVERWEAAIEENKELERNRAEHNGMSSTVQGEQYDISTLGE